MSPVTAGPRRCAPDFPWRFFLDGCAPGPAPPSRRARNRAVKPVRPARVAAYGFRLVAVAAEGARAAGCDWLHVDFTPELRGFYFGSCGFRPADAGLIAL